MKRKRFSMFNRILFVSLLGAMLLSVPVLALEAREGELTIRATEIVDDGDGKTITLEFDNQSGCTVQLGWGGNSVLSVKTSEGTYSLSLNILTTGGVEQVLSGKSTHTYTVTPCPGKVEQISLTNLYALESGSNLPDHQLNEAVVYLADEPDECIWDIAAARENAEAMERAWQERMDSVISTVQGAAQGQTGSWQGDSQAWQPESGQTDAVQGQTGNWQENSQAWQPKSDQHSAIQGQPAETGELTICATEIENVGNGKNITLEFDNQTGCTIRFGWAGGCVLSVTTSEGTCTLPIDSYINGKENQILSGKSVRTYTVTPCPGEVEQISLTNLRALEPGSVTPDYQLKEAVVYHAGEPDGCIWDIAAEKTFVGKMKKHFSDFGLFGLLIALFSGAVIICVAWQLLNPNSTTRRQIRLERLVIKRRLEEEENYAKGKKQKQGWKAGSQRPTEDAEVQLCKNQEQLERYFSRYHKRLDEVRESPDDISIMEEAQGIARNLLTTMVRGIWLSRTGTPPPEQGEENRLEVQINRIADMGYITEKSRDNYHQIRKICNAGAHAEWKAVEPMELSRKLMQEIFFCVVKYNMFLSNICRDYVAGKLPSEEQSRMDHTELWQFIRENLNDIGEEILSSVGSQGTADGQSGAQAAQQAWWFQQQDQQFQQQTQQFQQQVQQEQFNHFSWQSVNQIPDGGFVPPPPPPPTNPF